jgi:hypothetical protein
VWGTKGAPGYYRTIFGQQAGHTVDFGSFQTTDFALIIKSRNTKASGENLGGLFCDWLALWLAPLTKPIPELVNCLFFLVGEEMRINIVCYPDVAMAQPL